MSYCKHWALQALKKRLVNGQREKRRLRVSPKDDAGKDQTLPEFLSASQVMRESQDDNFKRWEPLTILLRTVLVARWLGASHPFRKTKNSTFFSKRVSSLIGTREDPCHWSR